MGITRPYYYIQIVFCILCSWSVQAQNARAFQGMYLEAKEAYKKEAYQQAFEQFKMLTSVDPANNFTEIAHYYCALSAFKLEKYVDARFMLVRLLSDYPEWENLDDARYLLANVYLEEYESEKAADKIQEIIRKDLQQQGRKMLFHYALNTGDVEGVKKLQRLNETDTEIAKNLADVLSVYYQSPINKNLLAYLVQDYRLKKSDYSHALGKESKRKSEYNVAVLLPFNFAVKELPNRYTKYLEFYNGVRLAVDSLATQGIVINLFAYDTEKDTAVIHKILEKPELKGMDLVIGPAFSSSVRAFSEYSEATQILTIVPFINQSTIIKEKDFTVFHLPTPESIGRTTADYTCKMNEKKNVLIFYSESLSDSLEAYAHKKAVEEMGKTVTKIKKVSRNDAKELKKHIESIDTAKVSYVYIASAENIVAATVISALEEKNSKFPVFVPNSWLNYQIITYTQFLRRNIHFIATDYLDEKSYWMKQFKTRYKNAHGINPMNLHYASTGYEIMFYHGLKLARFGNYYLPELKGKKYESGILTSGFNYYKANNNQVVPIIKFDTEFNFEWVNNPRLYYEDNK